MNLPRIFANAVARRFAFVVVGLVAAFVASCFGEAKAQAYNLPTACPNSNPRVCDQGEAYQDALSRIEPACKAWHPDGLVNWEGGLSWQQAEVRLVSNDGYQPILGCYRKNSAGTPVAGLNYSLATAHFKACPEGEPWNEAEKVCGLNCSGRSPLGPGAWGGVNADMQMCQDGCTFEGGIGGGVGVCFSVVIDGTTYQQCTSWGPTGDACSAGVGNGSLAPPDSDGDGSSDGNDSSPNNPGSGGGGKDGKPGEDGSSACGGPGQPACAEDGSNSGSGKGNTSGGGGNCQTPPSSTGDAILAQIAYQAWATRCAVEGLGEGGTGTGPGDGDGDQPDWTKGDGPDAPEDTSEEDVAESSSWGIGISADLLDTENIFGESSCPALPSLSIMGYDIDTASFSWWCTLVSIMRAAILIMGAFTAIQILLGRF